MFNKSAILILLTLGACAETPPPDPTPHNIAAQAACALDGMLIASHDGPKAQLLRRDGSRYFFCDAKEVFEEVLDPVRSKRVAAIWFQTLDDDPWESHPDHWSPAADLHFVVGSAKMGAMGPTLAPFKDRLKAEKFVADHGGNIHTYAQIDRALIKKVQLQGIEDM